MLWVARIIVAASALWLTGLAVAIFVVRPRAVKFLGSFAATARAHYTEHVLRLSSGIAFIVVAPEMRFPRLFGTFGWVLATTSVILLVLPWQWHRRFGEWAIPLAIRFIRAFAIASFALGGFILFALVG